MATEILKRIQEYEEFLNRAKQAVETLRQFEKLHLPNGNGNGTSKKVRRNLRELILKQLQDSPKTVVQLQKSLGSNPEYLRQLLHSLKKAKEVEHHGGLWGLKIVKTIGKRATLRDERNQKILDYLRKNGSSTARTIHNALKLHKRPEGIYGPLHELEKKGLVINQDTSSNVSDWSAV